jgi:hypothetical protein
MPQKASRKKEGIVKRKMQNVSFKTIDDFLEFLPEDELKMVELLRKLIFYCIPDCEEKIFLQRSFL